MAEYWKGAHSVFAIHLHVVWISKYRGLASSLEIVSSQLETLHSLVGARVQWGVGEILYFNLEQATNAMESGGHSWGKGNLRPGWEPTFPCY